MTAMRRLSLLIGAALAGTLAIGLPLSWGHPIHVESAWVRGLTATE